MAEEKKENQNQLAGEKTDLPKVEKKRKGSIIKKILIILLSFIFLLLIFLVLLRFNVFGLGSKLGPAMRNFPLSSLYLPPEVNNVEIDPETGEEVVSEPEESVAELKEILKLTESELKKKEEEADILMKQMQALKQENQRLMIFEKNQVEFEEDKKAFDQFIIDSTDKQAFADWYQKLNPDNAAKLYQEVMGELADQEELEKLTKIYAEMKPKPAAAVLEKMSSTRLEMVAMILKNLDTDQAGKIMNEMDAKVAARITTYLYPQQQ